MKLNLYYYFNLIDHYFMENYYYFGFLFNLNSKLFLDLNFYFNHFLQKAI
jgi:hypothetical protein